MQSGSQLSIVSEDCFGESQREGFRFTTVTCLPGNPTDAFFLNSKQILNIKYLFSREH